MVTKKKQRPLYQRVAIDVAGFGLIIIAPFLGWLPGPGGIPLFLIGLGLVSLNHEWAENLLKDFERKRVEFTNKYLMTSPRISFTIDLFCIFLIAISAIFLVSYSRIIYRIPFLFIISISIIVLLSNQKRFERIAKKLKKIFKK